MELLKLSADDRVVKVRNRALSTDDGGLEVLVGLDRQQSEWILASVDQEVRTMSDEERGRYLKLYTKHERARLAALGGLRPRAIDF